MEKVIFDTNMIRNTEPKNFLGGREQLKQFSKVAEIIFPDIVIEELKYQKRKHLEKHKKTFLENPFHWLRNINQHDTESFNNEAHITELEKNEDIKYSVIKLQDYSVLERIKELALKKLPPFEKDDGTDKGFKDTYIYFTILEYLQTIQDKYIYVCTKDGRLKEALQEQINIKVIKDFEDFRKESISFFHEEYFINKLQEIVNPNITAKSILNYSININGNQILLIEIADEKLVVEVDEREIICFENTKSYDIDYLINSNNYSTTHSEVAKLNNFKHFFSDEDISQILEATISNNQINWIINDTDVKQFIGDLFEAKKETLEKQTRQQLEELISNP